MDHVSRADIVDEARTWVGTPFIHQQSVKGSGTDCVGVLRGIWRKFYGPEPEGIPEYPMRVDLLEYSIMTEFADKYLIAQQDLTPVLGNVYVMRFREGSPVHHAAIYTEKGRYVHAWGGRIIRSVVESALPGNAKVVGAYCFPGVI